MLVIISVEVGVREFDSYLLLAHQLVSRGFECMLLYDQLARIVCFELAKQNVSYVLIDKSASISCLGKRIIPCKQGSNSLVYILFQESFMRHSSSHLSGSLWNKYTDLESLKYVDHFFMFGDYSLGSLAERVEFDGKCTATGNPRLDLLHERFGFFYEEEVAAIRSIYGDFLLYNDAHLFPETNKNRSNQGIGIPQLWLEDVEFAKSINEFMKLKFEFTSSFSRLASKFLQELASCQDLNIVVRPHPNNKESVWTSAFEEYPNVAVNYTLPVEPWLLSAKALLVEGCTTGSQMLCAGRHAISLDILDPPDCFPSIFKTLTTSHARNVSDVVDILRPRSLAGSVADEQLLSHYMIHDGLAADRIVRKIMADVQNSGMPGSVSPLVDVRRVDFSSLKLYQQPWKWQRIGTNKVASKIHLLDHNLGGNTSYRFLGHNSYAFYSDV